MSAMGHDYRDIHHPFNTIAFRSQSMNMAWAWLTNKYVQKLTLVITHCLHLNRIKLFPVEVRLSICSVGLDSHIGQTVIYAAAALVNARRSKPAPVLWSSSGGGKQMTLIILCATLEHVMPDALGTTWEEVAFASQNRNTRTFRSWPQPWSNRERRLCSRWFVFSEAWSQITLAIKV